MMFFTYYYANFILIFATLVLESELCGKVDVLPLLGFELRLKVIPALTTFSSENTFGSVCCPKLKLKIVNEHSLTTNTTVIPCI